MALSNVHLIGATSVEENVARTTVCWKLWNVTASVVVYADRQSIMFFDFKRRRVHHLWDTGSYECFHIVQLARATDNPRVINVELSLQMNRYAFYYAKPNPRAWGHLEQLVLHNQHRRHIPDTLVSWVRHVKQRLVEH